MRGSRKFFSGVQVYLFIFLVDEGREGPNTAINGPSSAHQLNAIKMVFRWRVDDGPPLNAGLEAL